MLGWMVPNFAARWWSEFRIDWMGCEPSNYLHRAVGRADKALFDNIVGCQDVDYNIQDSEGHSILFKLLSRKDYAWAQEAISLGSKILMEEKGAIDLLMSAAKTSNEDTLFILLHRMQFDVNAKDPAGLTVIHHAVSKNTLSTIKLILKLSPDVSVRDANGLSLMHKAAQNGSEEVMEALILHSPLEMRANLKDDKGLTPMYYALYNNHVNAASFLEHHHAKLDFINEAEKELLNYASANGWVDVTKFLCEKGADVHHTGKNGLTPMLDAIKNDRSEIVGVLKSHGADLNFKDDQGNTSAHYAVKSSEMLEQIAKYGAKLDNAKKDGKTPLFMAVFKAHRGDKDTPEFIKSAKFLFSKGCKLDFTKPENAALLADNKGKEMFYLLMKNGGKDGLNIMDADNKNSLHKALDKGDFEQVARLVKAGAKLHLNDLRIANMPMQLAKEGSKDAPELINFLYKKGLSINWSEVMNTALLNSQGPDTNSFKVAEELRREGVTADWTNLEMQNWFVRASTQLKPAALKKLCEYYKADVYAVDNNGKGQNAVYYALKNDNVKTFKVLLPFVEIKKLGFNPYSIAIDNGSVEVIKALPKEGVNDIDRKTDYTPLTYAIIKGKVQIVEELASHTNVDVNIKDGHGYAPIHYALRIKSASLIKLLTARHVSLDVKGEDGKSAIDMIKSMKPFEIEISESKDMLAVLIKYKPEIAEIVEGIKADAYRNLVNDQALKAKLQEENKLKELERVSKEINSKIPAFNPGAEHQGPKPSAPTMDDEMPELKPCYYFPDQNGSEFMPSAPSEDEISAVNPAWQQEQQVKLSTYGIPPFNPLHDPQPSAPSDD